MTNPTLTAYLRRAVSRTLGVEVDPETDKGTLLAKLLSARGPRSVFELGLV